ncbi:MAG: DnaJ domain-containing protein [Phycisphaerales bacterium]
MSQTMYDILGVTPNASAEQIKRAYREAARRHHPDVSESGDAAERFAEATRAYQVLSDPESRREYDATLAGRGGATQAAPGRAHYTWTNVATHASAENGGASHAGKADLDEMYNAFFGSRNSKTGDG